MTTRTREVRHQETEDVRHVSFYTTDAKGRVQGADVVRFESTFEPTTEPWGSAMAPGRYFGAYVRVTRDRKRFGATQGNAYFTTEAEREAYITKRLEGARRRAGG